MRLVGVCLVGLILLSGCVADLPTPLDDAQNQNGPRESWEWFGEGTAAWRLRFLDGPVGAECQARLNVEGYSDRFEYVGFLGTQRGGDHVPTRFTGSDTDQLGLPRAQASVSGIPLETGPIVHRPEWSKYASLSLTLTEETVLYVAFVGTAKTDLRPQWTNVTELPAPAWLRVECDRPIPEPALHTATGFSLLDERLLTEGTSLHAGTTDGGRLAHVAARSGTSFRAEDELVLLGSMSGEPPKAGVLTLEHAEVSHRWIFVPGYALVIGDVFLEFEGPPGDYRLELTSIHGGPLIAFWVAMLSFPPPG